VAESWTGDDRAVRAFRRSPHAQFDPARWPATVSAIAQILRDGLELPAGLSVLVGENGSGKSTVVETLAEAYGLNPQGGSIQARLFQVRDSEPGLGSTLMVERAPSWRSHWAYFLRADTMHGMYSYLENNPGLRPERFHELSHPEGFLQMLRTRVNQHSPMIAAIPGASLLELGDRGIRTARWDELDLVRHWRLFRTEPDSCFRRLL
jgi:predicted ATPase